MSVSVIKVSVKWLPRYLLLMQEPRELSRPQQARVGGCEEGERGGEYSCKIPNKRKQRDGVMGGFGMRDSCGNQTIVLRS